MQKLVITYSYSDWECSGEINECLEYESAEQLAFDLELFLEENQDKWDVCFHGKQFNPLQFFVTSERTGKKIYCPPDIQTLDEWFENKKNELIFP